jgi:aryl-alcohol dehydrogenase-like predicted oxidoreductase
MIQRALKLGVNYFDTSAIYRGPETWSERVIAIPSSSDRTETHTSETG